MTTPISDTDLGALETAKVVDARGSACPGPLLEAKKAMNTVQVGQIIEIWSSDAATKTDIGAWSARSATRSSAPWRARATSATSWCARSSGRPAQRRIHRRSQVAMTTLAPEKPQEATRTFVPRILVFSTNNISDPGIDLAGSAHMNYSPGVVVISLPCTSGIRPTWILHAIEHGFDGVFIASDGDECAYLADCSTRASRDRRPGPGAARRGRPPVVAAEDGGDLLRLRRAVRPAHRAVRRGARRRSARRWCM